MAPINIDVSQATPQIELPSPARANSKTDSPSFDSHLQRASEQRPASPTTASSTAPDSQPDQQESAPQSTPTNTASGSSNSSPLAKAETTDSQQSEPNEASVLDEAQSADATGDRPSDAEDEPIIEPVTTDLFPTQPPVVAIVETPTPIPVAVSGCEQEQPTDEVPVVNVPTEIEGPTPTRPAGPEANVKANYSPVPEMPKLEADVQPVEVSPVEDAAPVTDETPATVVVSQAVAPAPSEPGEEPSETKEPETPKISSMHRYDVRQPATTHKLAHEVHPDEQPASESGEDAEKVTESKPTGRRSERNKVVATNTDERTKRTDAEPAPTNVAPTSTPAQVAAATIVDPLPQPGVTSSPPSNDASVAPTVAECAAPSASQTPDAPATRPLPAEPANSTNRVTGSHHQVEHRPNSEFSESDRARFVQRVTKAFQTASERGGPLKLRLSPPELGSVRMEVSLKDGALSARLEAESPAARAALLENLPALRERLAEQNVRIEKFDVDLKDPTAGGSGNGPTSDPDTDRNPRSPHWRGMRREQESAAIAPAPVPVSASGLDQLNVVI